MPHLSGGVAGLCIVVAVMHEQLLVVQMMLPHHTKDVANVKIERNGLFLNALEHAILTKQPKTIELLVREGYKIELFVDEATFFSLLDDVVNTVQLERVQILLLVLLETAYREAISTVSRWNILDDLRAMDALDRACYNGYDDIVEVMLKYGVNPDSLTATDTQRLFVAISRSRISTIKLLLRHGVSIGFTAQGFPLTFASSRGDADVVELLLEHEEVNDNPSEGGNIFALDRNSRPIPRICLCPSPLYVACCCGNIGVVRKLIAAGEEIDQISPTSFVYLSRDGDGISCETVPYPAMRELNKPMLHSEAPRWETPMAAAVYQGHIDIVELLLQNQPKKPLDFHAPTPPRVNWKKSVSTTHYDSPLDTALRILCAHQTEPATDLEILVAAGIDPLTVQLDGESLFNWALDNDETYLQKAIRKKLSFDLVLLFHCTTELYTCDPIERRRMHYV